MEALGDRLSFVLSSREMTRTELARMVGVTPAQISAICLNKTLASDRTITDICEALCINEHWLRTGEGPMMQETPKTIVEELVKRYNLTGDAVRILNIIAQAFQRLTPEQAHDMVEIARRELLAIDDPDAARDVSAMREAVHDETSPDEAGHEAHGS